MSIVVAGANGDLGSRIVRALQRQGANVKALVRPGKSVEGVTNIESDFQGVDALAAKLEGATVVISALSGLRQTIVTAQTTLLDAAIKAQVPRFFPSDFAIDFMKLPPGINRNFDLRREFHEQLEGRLQRKAIEATSILNGAFMDMLTGQAPYVLPQIRRVMVWGDPSQRIDFTTKDDVADFTAHAAIDRSTPRWLRISGQTVTSIELAEIASSLSGKTFSVLRLGDTTRLERIIHFLRAVHPAPGELYPPWQGMQYMLAGALGTGALQPLDNARYAMPWIQIRDVLATRLR